MEALNESSKLVAQALLYLKEWVSREYVLKMRPSDYALVDDAALLLEQALEKLSSNIN